MRVGELTASQHTLKARDVHIGVNKKKLLLILHSSKMHGKHRNPQMIKINCMNKAIDYKPEARINTRSNTCPFNVITDYVQIRNGYKAINERFFVFSDKSPVTAMNMRGVLKGVLSKEGFNDQFYNTHSLCAGRLVDLWRAQISVPTIAKLGRWSSNAVYSYLKVT